MNADRSLEWLENALSSPYLMTKIAELPGAATPGPHHFARILDTGIKADSV